MPSIGELRRGSRVIIDNEPYLVVTYEFNKPGKGTGLYRTKLRNLLSGSTIERTFRSGDTFESAQLDQRTMQFLYREDGNFYFMDTTNYEQTNIDEAALGDVKNWLVDNLTVEVLFFRDKAIGVNIPSFINLRVVSTEAWAKGDTSSNDYKTAVVESGAHVKVPPFVNEGDLIQIDTRTGDYVTRVKA